MTDPESLLDRPLSRVLGERSTAPDGPVLLVTVGVHGNEPAGVFAARRVLVALERENIPLRGLFRVLVGNLAALAAGVRFLDHDLNRHWSAEGVAELGTRVDTLRREERERWELAGEIERAVATSRDPVQLLDMHSFSADGSPFVILGDTLRNRRLAFPLRIPIVLGLEETIEGTLLSYLVEKGHVAAVIEGGRHEDLRTIDRLEAALWLALKASGCVDPRDVRERVRGAEQMLSADARGLPRAVEVSYRECIEPDDGFVMGPGYLNLQRVEEGEVLAHDADGPIVCPQQGHILMPLYQKQGRDGFFLTRPVAMFWLYLSAMIRWLHLERVLVPLMPGVRRHPERNRALLVNSRVARWAVVEVFRLLGYRPHGAEGDRLLFTRRRDWAPRSQR